MIEKEFIPYEQALALKELGFDEEQCLGWYESFYSSGTPHLQTEWLEEYLDFDILVPASLYQQAFRWFREKRSYSCSVDYDDETNDYQYKYVYMNNGYVFSKKYDTYEEAELECLKKLIEIVKNDVHRRRSGNTND